jgi:hypothetical protein
MALADPTATSRVVITYHDGENDHTAGFHFPSDTLADAFPGLFTDFVAANSSCFGSDWVTLSAILYPLGSVFSRDVPIDVQAGSGEPFVNGWSAPRFVSMVGRSAEGVRARSYLYGVFIPTDDLTYRYTPGENSLLDELRHDWVQLFDLGGACAADGNPILWRAYLNTGFNSYWQRKQRG